MAKITKYRKLPIDVEVLHYTGDYVAWYEVLDFVGNSIYPVSPVDGDLILETLEGRMRVSVGDYIIKGIKGEFWAVKPDIFALTYETICDYCNEGGGLHSMNCAIALTDLHKEGEDNK